MNDLISRQAVLDIFADNADATRPYSTAWEKIRDLPSVNPQPTECEDAVSRQVVLDAVNDVIADYVPNLFGRYEALPLEIASAINRLPSVNPQPKWIPVSERLPEDEQEILFSTKTGRVYSGKYHDDDSANQWYSHKDKCRAWNNVVSAWMPLPQPYEPQERRDKE